MNKFAVAILTIVMMLSTVTGFAASKKAVKKEATQSSKVQKKAKKKKTSAKAKTKKVKKSKKTEASA